MELKLAVQAANITLEELAEATGLHASSLSRAQHGLELPASQQLAIRKALRSASKKAAEAALKLHESLK
jgi:transcriptional regulator with XRE-family HTH domain